MNWLKLFIICALIIVACGNADAQTKKRTKPSAKTQVENSEQTLAKDTIREQEDNTPKYRSLTDPNIVKYIIGGRVKENKIYLMANQSYDLLDTNEKQLLLDKIAKEFPNRDIIIYTRSREYELWLGDIRGIKLFEKWNNDSLQLENYMPLELKKNGTMKIFYYIGGAFNGGDNYSSGRLNLRAGTYLFKSIVDASVTTNIGYNKSGEKSQFAGDIGIDSRAYPPFLRIPKINLSPYAGAGVSWVMPPINYFELRLLVGAAWFIGPGSLDVGTQYGTKTGYSFSIGYTFRPSFNKGNP